MKTNNITRLKAIVIILFGFCITSCRINSSVVEEKDYPTKIVGSWLGTVGDLQETMTINSDCTFVCLVYPDGFIAKTLSQGVKGTINGTWRIAGTIITLNITGAKNEHLENKVALSTILSLKENELVLKSDKGETSVFEREKPFLIKK